VIGVVVVIFFLIYRGIEKKKEKKNGRRLANGAVGKHQELLEAQQRLVDLVPEGAMRKKIFFFFKFREANPAKKKKWIHKREHQQ
jgi:hypothetical protein